MRRRAPRPLAASLESVAAALEPATTLARVQRVWTQAVGPGVAREAEPVAERGGTLTVACRSSVWAQELDLMAPDVIRALNEALGADPIVALRCRATRPAIRP
jgi:predicted nucleic acid-binding Zn ribbon protein